MSMIKFKRILSDKFVLRPAGISGFSGISGTVPASGYSGISGSSSSSGTSGIAEPVDPVDPVVDPPIADDNGTLPIPPGISGYSGEPDPVTLEVDIYINPDWVIAIEPDAMEGTCNVHLITGWYHVSGDMEAVVDKMGSWFGKRKMVEE